MVASFTRPPRVACSSGIISRMILRFPRCKSRYGYKIGEIREELPQKTDLLLFLASKVKEKRLYLVVHELLGVGTFFQACCLEEVPETWQCHIVPVKIWCSLQKRGTLDSKCIIREGIIWSKAIFKCFASATEQYGESACQMTRNELCTKARYWERASGKCREKTHRMIDIAHSILMVNLLVDGCLWVRSKKHSCQGVLNSIAIHLCLFDCSHISCTLQGMAQINVPRKDPARARLER